MDNAMVKRGIGAVVLAIIAALLLGYLLKDKSRDREAAVEMKLPGAPELTIPSLADTTDKITDSAATLVGEAKDKVKDVGNSVVASATGLTTTLSYTASKTMDAVKDSTTSSIKEVTQTTEQSSANPGFSFRPPNKNEEQQINTSSSEGSANNTTVTAAPKNNDVVASAPKVTPKKEAKVFKPTIEKEPEKVVKKKAPAKKAAPKPKVVAKAPATATTSSGGKYSIQLLATSSQSRANKLAKTMNSEGYVSFITQTTSNNKILYRVRVGGHKERNAALSAQETMKRRYQKNFFVQNSLVVSQ